MNAVTPRSPESGERQGMAVSAHLLSTAIKHTFALVLAGGRGSRLVQLTDWRAKPAVPFGGKFRILDFPLSNCVNSGIRRIGVATQYKAQSLIQHIQRGWSFLDGRFKEFVDVLPAQQQVEGTWYQGTADAAFQNLDVLRRDDPEYMLILAGDHVYKMDYSKLIAYHIEKSADVTVACIEVAREDAKAFGVMQVDDEGRIIDFLEKPADPPAMPGKPDRALASMGIYVFNSRFLYEQLVYDADDPRSSHDFGKDLLPRLVPRYRVYAQPFDQSCVNIAGGVPYWRDVGTVDAYWEANLELTHVLPALNLYDQQWPIWTYHEQLPPAKFVVVGQDHQGVAMESMVSGGCVISGAMVRRSLLFSSVRVESQSDIEDSVILPRVNIGHQVRLKRVVVDKGCVIPDGLTVGIDIEQDRKRFHVTERGVTLVTPEMLGQRVHHLR